MATHAIPAPSAEVWWRGSPRPTPAPPGSGRPSSACWHSSTPRRSSPPSCRSSRPPRAAAGLARCHWRPRPGSSRACSPSRRRPAASRPRSPAWRSRRSPCLPAARGRPGAPLALRGRYMATAGLSWWLGLAVAPTLGGQLLAVSPTLPLIAGAALAAATIALLRGFERALPAGVRSIPSRTRDRGGTARGEAYRALECFTSIDPSVRTAWSRRCARCSRTRCRTRSRPRWSPCRRAAWSAG